MARETTLDTRKPIPGGAVGCSGMLAAGAGAGSVARIDQDYLHPSSPGLVLDKGPELGKGPRMLGASLGLFNREPVADPPEVFQGNPAAGALSLGHQLLGKGVVHIPGKPRLLPTAPLQEALGGGGAFGLEPGPKTGMSFPQAVDLASGEDLPLRVCGQVFDPQVDAQEIPWGLADPLFHLTGSQQEELATLEDQITLPTTEVEQIELLSAAGEGHSDAALHGPDRHSSLVWVPAENPVVIGDGAAGMETPSLLPIQLIGIGHLGDAAHHHLGTQPEERLGFPVGAVVDGVLAEDLVVPGPFGEVVTGLVGLLQGQPQDLMLIGRGQEFDLGGQLHNHHSNRLMQPCQVIHRWGPAPKG